MKYTKSDSSSCRRVSRSTGCCPHSPSTLRVGQSAIEHVEAPVAKHVEAPASFSNYRLLPFDKLRARPKHRLLPARTEHPSGGAICD